MPNILPSSNRSRKMTSQKTNNTLLRFVKFNISTLAGTGVDMLVLWLMSDFVFKNNYWGEYLLSPLISFECAVLTNFTIAYFIVWKDRISRRSWRSYYRHYFAYNLSCTGVFFIKMGFLLVIERLFKLDVLLCNIIALCFSGIFNFIMNEWVIFGNKHRHGKTDNADSTNQEEQ